MAKKEVKKLVDVCKKCGEDPCACVKEEVKAEVKVKPKPVIEDEGYSTRIMQDGTTFKVFADGTEEEIK